MRNKLFGKKKSNKLYQRFTMPFDDVLKFIKENYNEGSYLIPLGANIDCILDGSDDESVPDEMQEDYEGDINAIDRTFSKANERSKEMLKAYNNIYDYRLVRSYIRSGDSLQEINVKRFGDENGKGALSSVKFVLEGSDNFHIPFAGKICKNLQKKYDEYMGKRDILIWVPLWNVRNKEATVINLFDRIDIVFT